MRLNLLSLDRSVVGFVPHSLLLSLKLLWLCPLILSTLFSHFDVIHVDLISYGLQECLVYKILLVDCEDGVIAGGFNHNDSMQDVVGVGLIKKLSFRTYFRNVGMWLCKVIFLDKLIVFVNQKTFHLVYDFLVDSKVD